MDGWYTDRIITTVAPVHAEVGAPVAEHIPVHRICFIVIDLVLRMQTALRLIASFFVKMRLTI